jgi:16S rRNA U1498 N3-methylase RsmE
MSFIELIKILGNHLLRITRLNKGSHVLVFTINIFKYSKWVIAAAEKERDYYHSSSIAVFY